MRLCEGPLRGRVSSGETVLENDRYVTLIPRSCVLSSSPGTRGQKRIKSGHIENQQIAHWRLTVKIGFTFEDAMNARRSLL